MTVYQSESDKSRSRSRPRPEDPDAEGSQGFKEGNVSPGTGEPQSSRLLKLASRIELFHSSDAKSFATIRRGQKLETHPIRSSAIKAGFASSIVSGAITEDSSLDDTLADNGANSSNELPRRIAARAAQARSTDPTPSLTAHMIHPPDAGCETRFRRRIIA